jgi:hypothetical protein
VIPFRISPRWLRNQKPAVAFTLLPTDDDTRMRARGWALALGQAYVAASQDDEAMGAPGRAMIDAALTAR